MNKAKIAIAAASLAVAGAAGQPAAAYPIDCAILLCLAGGFPPSAECAAAKAEMIRRITPWPVEPPLQLWNCPLAIPADIAAAIGMTNVGLGPDGLTPDVRKYRDAVEIYHIRRYSRRTGGDDGLVITDYTERGVYDEQGDFHWVNASFEMGPAWLSDAVGGRRVTITECVSWTNQGETCRQTASHEENRASGLGGWGGGGLRGVAIRTQDWEGKYQTEWVSY